MIVPRFSVEFGGAQVTAIAGLSLIASSGRREFAYGKPWDVSVLPQHMRPARLAHSKGASDSLGFLSILVTRR